MPPPPHPLSRLSILKWDGVPCQQHRYAAFTITLLIFRCLERYGDVDSEKWIHLTWLNDELVHSFSWQRSHPVCRWYWIRSMACIACLIYEHKTTSTHEYAHTCTRKRARAHTDTHGRTRTHTHIHMDKDIHRQQAHIRTRSTTWNRTYFKQ